MDRRLLNYYNRELQHIREMGAEFAREFPKIAGRLALDEFSCADPYVERLIEGFAFLAARVQLKLDAEFPRFTQSLLNTIYPHYLCPTPSMAVAQFVPEMSEGALVEGVAVPRASAMRSITGKGDPTACEYRTAHDVKLFPLKVVEAQYYTRDLASLDLPAGIPPTKAALRIACLESPPTATFDKIRAERLAFYLRGSGDVQMRLYEQVFAHGVGIVVQPKGRPVRWREVIPATEIRQMGFEPSQALLPYDARSFQGYRLLHEYFAFPQRYMFFELGGLQRGFKRCADTQVDVVILLNEPDLRLEGAVEVSQFALFCTPVINLFPKSADRIHLSEQTYEFQVIPDRTRPLDFEVFQVLKVTGHGVRSDQEQPFTPFYSARDFQDEGGAYFTVNRVPRLASQKEQRQGQRSKYPGSEVYVSLVDAKSAPYRSELRQLSVDTLCTNRDLPMFVPVGKGATDFTLLAGAPLEAIKCVSNVPTSPRPSFAEGETAWRLISHLTLNYLSINDTSGGEGAAAMRDLLELYGDVTDPAIRKQIDGLRKITTEKSIRRVHTPGPIAFARGLRVNVELDESSFEGTGVFLLGAVLEQFFARYVSINSFTETVVRTIERGEVMRWPPRTGRRNIL